MDHQYFWEQLFYLCLGVARICGVVFIDDESNNMEGMYAKKQ